MGMTARQTTTTDNTGKYRRFARKKRWEAFLVFILVAFTVVFAGEHVFHRYKEQIKKDTQDELSGIAKLKAVQIISWIAERRGDAENLKDDPLFLAELERWLQQGGPSGTAKTELSQRLVSMQQSKAPYGCTAIALFDDKARLRLSTARKMMPEAAPELLQKSMRTGEIFLSDIHVDKGDSEELELNFVVPLYSALHGSKRNIGAVLFYIDPRQFLFPTIQIWPNPSPSAEILLVRREGNEVVFLNDLRHREHSALALRMPLTESGLPAARAASGWEGMVEGPDYRGVPVVGVINRIPGTTWKMVTKVDQAEIYAPINSLAKWIEVLMLAFVAAGAGIAMFWRKKELQLINALHRQREQALQHQALIRRLDYLTKYANDIIMLADDSGKIIDFNDRALEAYGYSAEEFSQMNIFELRKVEFTSKMFEDFRKVYETGALRLDATHVRKNGEEFPVEVSVRLVNFDGISCQQAIVRDITERKKAEAELTRQKEFFRQVIDSDPNLIFVRDAEGKFLHANKAMAQSFGYTTENIIGKFNWELTNDREQVEKYDRETRDVMASGELQVTLNTAILPDGKQHVYQTFRKPLIQEDGTISTLTIAMDISELKAAEEGLHRLNRALKLLGESNAAIVHIEEEDRLLAEICKLAVEIGGYRMAWVGLAEHDADRTVRPVAKYGRDEGYLDSVVISTKDNEATGLGPTGTTIITGKTQVNANTQTNSMMSFWRDAALSRGYLSSIALPLKGNRNTIGALTIYAAETDAFNTEEIKLLEELADNLAFGIGALRAIAWRDQAMEKLRQSEELFRYLTENTADVVFLMSMPNGRYDYVSPASTRLFGFTPQEFYDSPALIWTLIHPDSKAYVERQWEKFLAGEVPPYIEYCISHKSGTKKWLGQRNTPIWNMEKNGTLIAIQGVITDITERKLAEMQYEDEHRRLRTLIQTMPELVWLKDPNGIYLSCNPQFERYFGAKEADIVGKTDYAFIPAELANDARQKDRDAMSLNQPVVSEKWIIYPDNGQHALLETVKVPMRDETGKLIGVMGIARDITQRKKVEDELKFKNTLLVTEHESSIDGILVVDESASTVLSFNRRFVEIWGIPEEVIESRSDLRFIDTVIGKLAEPEQFLDKVQYLYDHPQQTSRDELVLRDGRVIDRYSAPMNGPDGKYYGRIWFFRDITERKLAEKRESSLRHVLDNTLDMIFIFRPDSLQFVYMNKGALDSTGYSIEELLLMTPADINPQMSELEFREFIAPLIDDEQRVLRFESVHRRKSGTDLPVEVLLQLVQENGGDKMFVAIVRDITERKRAEKALRRQQAFMLQVIDTDPNRIVVKDANGNVLLANRSMAAAHGMTPDELVGRNLREINLSPDALAVYLEDDRKVIEEGCAISQLDSVALPDGEQGWLLTEKKRLWMPDGKLCVLSISADITQQKLSEIQLAESYKELQRLSLHMENARADERAKIALNLHDEMGATLAALKMRISWLASKLPAELPQLTEEAGHITELVSGGIHTMHRIVTQLRPNLLGDVGLSAAIADYVKKFRQHTNIECLLDLPKDEIVLNANQSHTVFRILQESLNNVAKHAQASRVNITLAERDDSLMMVVRDNGVGFEPSAHKEHAFGLLGIKERALMVGGKARITSKPGKGTRVAVSIPPA